MPLFIRQPPQTVLDNDDGAVHDQAKIEGTETHQVARYPGMHHTGNRHEHGQRDHHGCNQCSAPVAQQQEQYGNHQQRTLDEVLLDRGDGFIHQRGTVVEWFQFDALGQRRLDGLEFARRGACHLAAVFPDQHEYRTEHDFPAGLCRRTGTQFTADPDVGYIMQGKRHTVAPRYGDAADVIQADDLSG